MTKNPHTELINNILLDIGSTNYCRVWKNHTGGAVPIGALKVMHSLYGDMIPYHELMRYTIQFGLKGSSDIIGIHMNTGKFLAIEGKTGKAKQSKQQLAFEKMINYFNGEYKVIRPEGSALKWIESL